MKNERVVRAYDSINPSAADKQKMLNVILQEAHLEEKPVKTGKMRETVAYTTRAHKSNKKSNFMAIAASLILLLISGLVLSRMVRQPENTVLEQPTETIVFEDNAAVHYAPILKKYQHAIFEGWTKQQCEIDGISLRMQAGYDVTKAGYVFLDLDGDSREELIIAEESTDRTDNIWDLYTTLGDGTPVQIWVDELTGGQCRLYEGNVISISDSYDDELEMTFYDLKAGQLVMRESLQWENEDTVFHTDADGNTRQVSSREGQEISYAYDGQKLNLTWLADIPDYLRYMDVVERYTPVIEKYKTALTENWTSERCEENDISSQIFSGLADQEKLGWCLMDVDKNGVNELVISDGERIFDLYTLSNQGIPEHILTATGPNAFRLCGDGILQEQIFFSKGCSWYFYQLSEGKQELLNVLTYRNEYEGSEAAEGYYYGTNEDNGERISKDQAGEILSRYQPMNLQLTPLVDWDFDIFDDVAAYDSLIDVYQQALTEKWDAEKCLQQDISMMISRFQEDPGKINAVYLDLDKDGMNELLITDGMIIYDLYTLTDGGPVHLLTGWERNSYRYCMEDVIFNHASGSAFNTCYRYYRLENGELVVVDSVVFDASVNPDNPWFRSADGETPETPLTEQEATAIMGSYKDLSLLGTSILEID